MIKKDDKAKNQLNELKKAKTLEKKQKEKKTQTKQNLLQKILTKATKKKKQNTQNTQEPQKPEKPKAPFKVIMCITFASYGNKIIDIFNAKGITDSMTIKGYGTAQTSLLSMLGINETERDVVFALVKTNQSNNLISDMLTEFDKNNIKNTFCCLLSPSSASLEMIKAITTINNENTNANENANINTNENAN